jgi:N-methylhydantoinase B
LTDTQVTLLADRRTRGPYGLAGGSDGAPGRSVIIREDGSEEVLSGKSSTRLRSGERIRVETPGGGGWGKPKRSDDRVIGSSAPRRITR